MLQKGSEEMKCIECKEGTLEESDFDKGIVICDKCGCVFKATKDRCAYCDKGFDIKKKYPITYNHKTKYPRYCSTMCQSRANNLRTFKENAYKKLNETDKKYLKKVKR